jgi:hypothetical protein
MSAREVIARALCKHRNKDSVVGYCVGVPGDDCAGDCSHFWHTDDFLAALDAAGLAVVEKKDVAGIGALLATDRSIIGTLHNALNCIIHEEDNDPPDALNAVRIARNALDEVRTMLAAAKEGER